MNPIQILKSANFIVNSVLIQILNQFQQILHEKQVSNSYPQFTHKYFTQVFNQKINQFTPNYHCIKTARIIQQKVQEIPKILIDNLCPKQLSNQQSSSQIKQLAEISQKGSKKLNITNRSSFIKLKISQISSIPSRIQNQQSSIIKKSKQQQTFKSIVENEQDDPHIQNLRKMVEFKCKQKEKQFKMKQDKIKHHQEKVQMFSKQYDNVPDVHIQQNAKEKKFTFDYAGQTLQADCSQDQKLVYYSIKYGMRTLTKGFKTANKNKQENKDNEIRSNSYTQRLKQSKQSRQMIDLHQTIQIPKFSQQYRTSIFETDPNKLKINQFKRLYGRKFSRYDKNSVTIEVTQSKQKNQTEQSFFNGKRHLKDQKSLNKSIGNSLSKYSPRKIALPKLKGKYKVLDHYNYDESHLSYE